MGRFLIAVKSTTLSKTSGLRWNPSLVPEQTTPHAQTAGICTFPVGSATSSTSAPTCFGRCITPLENILNTSKQLILIIKMGGDVINQRV